jgi:hypothetical protein
MMKIVAACFISIASHNGGSIADHGALVRIAQAANCQIRIEGRCDSACTMLLSVACVDPRARLGFHAPNWQGRPMAELDRASAAEHVARHYPPAIRDWYLDGPAHHARKTVITGQAAIAAGARPCEGGAR